MSYLLKLENEYLREIPT